MKKEFKIRKYRKGDEIELVKLHREIFNSNMTLEYWKWKYEQNPYGFHIWVAVDTKTGEIVGQYGLVYKKAVFFGKEFLISNGIDICIKEDYRGQGFHMKCLRIHGSKYRGYLSISFPSNRAKLNAVKAVKAVKDGLLKIDKRDYIFKKKLSFFTKVNSDFKITEVIKNHKEEIDFFWNKKKKELKVSVIRDWEYLKWRVLDSPNKQRFFLLKFKGEIIGYFSLYKKNKNMYITDLLLLNDYLDKNISNVIEKFSKRAGCKFLIVMVSDKNLQKLFIQSKYKIIDYHDVICGGEAIKKNNLNLYLTFADIDMF